MNQTTESSHVMVIPQRRHALRIAFGYAAVSIIWILGSGWLLHYWVKDTDLAEHIEIYKGWLFVAVTAFLLWAALNRYFRAIRQSHGRLQENEAKFKAIVESAIIPISISKDNRIVFANQALASLFGHKTPETLAGKSITDLTEPDSRSPFFVRIDHPQHILAEEATFSQKILRPDGEIRTVEGKSSDVFIDGETYRLSTFHDITERKRAEKAVVESEDNYRSIFNATSDALFIHNATGAILDVNQRMCELFGYTHEEALTTNVGDLSVGVSPYSQAEAREKIQQALARSPQVFEWQCRRKNGELFWCEVSLKSSELGGKLRVIALVREITERKQAETMLRESQRQLSTLMGNLPGMAYRCKNTPDWPMIFVSEGSSALTGYLPADLMQSRPAYGDIIAAEHRQEVWDKVEAAVNNHRPFELVYQIVTAGKEHRWVWERGRGVYGEDGQLLFLEGFITDITQRKQAEEAFQLSERNYREIFNSANDAIFIHDADTGSVLDANDSMLRLFGFTRDEALSLTPSISSLEVSPYSMAEARQWMSKAVAEGPQVFEWHARKKSGELFWVEVALKSATINGQRRLLAVVRDITERKKAEESLQRQARLQDLLIKISATYINVPLGAVESAIQVSLGELAEHVGADRVRVFYYDFQQRTARLVHEWCREGFKSPVDFRDLAVAAYPDWDLNAHCLGEPIWVPDPTTLPPGALRERIQREGVQSLLAVPIMKAGECIGFISFHWVRHHHVCWGDEQRLLTAFGGMLVNIRQREQVEGSLRENQARFDQLAEQSRTVVWEVDSQGLFTYVSHVAQQAWGYEPKELVGRKHFYDLHPDEGREALKEAAFAIFNRKGVFKDRESPVLHKQGYILWVSTNAIPLLNDDGSLRGYRGADEDISERKRTERELITSEERYRGLVNTMMDIIYVVSTDGRIIFIGPQVTRYGFTVSGLLHRPFLDLVHPDDRAAMAVDFQHTLSTGDGEQKLSVFRTVTQDGRVVWFEETGRRTRDKAGNVIGISGMLRDITERKRAEEDRSRLTAAIEQVPETIVITDVKGNIVYANPAFEKTTGYTVAEALNQNPRIIKSGKHDAAFYKRMWQTLTSGQVWTGRLTNKNKEGSLYEEEVTITPVRDAADQVVGYIALKLDVTRQAQVERQLRQSQKMEAIGQLTGGVAHDFNNILTAFMMSLSLLQRKRNLDKTTLEVLEDLEAGATRASNLTRQLLMFSRRSVLEMRPLDLNEIAAGLLKMLGRLLGEHIDLVFEPVSQLPAVEADAGMMEQVLMNLAVNARDAMPRGGQITITVEPVEIHADQAVAHPDRREGLFVCLSVADTGHGMDEATLKRIFEPFYTTKEQGKGTGLGLATVYGIVAQHRGWMEVESQMGRGSKFSVFLPALEIPPVTKEPDGKQPVPNGHETLLVVEDEENLRWNLVQVLRNLGYQVLEAANGREALVRWKDHRQDIDLLLTDMVMPQGITGLELAESLREEKPALKIIITSGYSEEIATRGTDAIGGIVYLRKPYQISVLGQTVRGCLDSTNR